MKILLIVATSIIGSRIAAEALRCGHQIEHALVSRVRPSVDQQACNRSPSTATVWQDRAVRELVYLSPRTLIEDFGHSRRGPFI